VLEATESALSTPPTAGGGGAAPESSQRLAQGIICGPWALALSFDWARSIVEEFELSPIPKAPLWLVGAANIEGAIIPVVDLALYINPSAPGNPAGSQRLLVGGLSGISSEDAVALIFSRLPQQLRYTPQSLDDVDGLPPALHDLCSAYALDSSGQMYLEIDSERLMTALGDALQAQ
jgi:chemotaxis signal transduction protein